MYKNFKEYWKLKKNMYTKLGVDEDVAHTIWCDAADLTGQSVIKELMK